MEMLVSIESIVGSHVVWRFPTCGMLHPAFINIFMTIAHVISNLSQLTTRFSSANKSKQWQESLPQQHLAKQIVSHVHGTGAIEHEDQWADFQKMLHENAPVLLFTSRKRFVIISRIDGQHHYQDAEELWLVSRVDVVFFEFKRIVLGKNIDEIPVRIIAGSSYRILNPSPSSQTIYTLTYNLSQTPVSRQPQPLATLSRHTQVVWIAIILC
ncbi:hypothetical protein IAS59_004314 [Cryptococcus gattii]